MDDELQSSINLRPLEHYCAPWVRTFLEGHKRQQQQQQSTRENQGWKVLAIVIKLIKSLTVSVWQWLFRATVWCSIRLASENDAGDEWEMLLFAGTAAAPQFASPSSASAHGPRLWISDFSKKRIHRRNRNNTIGGNSSLHLTAVCHLLSHSAIEMAHFLFLDSVMSPNSIFRI